MITSTTFKHLFIFINFYINQIIKPYLADVNLLCLMKTP